MNKYGSEGPSREAIRSALRRSPADFEMMLMQFSSRWWSNQTHALVLETIDTLYHVYQAVHYNHHISDADVPRRAELWQM